MLPAPPAFLELQSGQKLDSCLPACDTTGLRALLQRNEAFMCFCLLPCLSDRLLPASCFSHSSSLHVFLHSIQEAPPCSSSRTPACHLQPQHVSPDTPKPSQSGLPGFITQNISFVNCSSVPLASWLLVLTNNVKLWLYVLKPMLCSSHRFGRRQKQGFADSEMPSDLGIEHLTGVGWGGVGGCDAVYDITKGQFHCLHVRVRYFHRVSKRK